MVKKKEYTFFSIIVGVFYISLLYLDCFSKKSMETYQLKYWIIWMLFLETTFSLCIEEEPLLWRNWLWKLRFAVIFADFYFLFTPYNAAGIGGYIVVQMIYKERLMQQKHIEGKSKSNLLAIEITSIVILTGIGILYGNYAIYILGAFYGWILYQNLKSVWKFYFKGERNILYLALSLSFLALCDTSILLNFIWKKELIGNLIWCFYVPSQLLLAKYE